MDEIRTEILVIGSGVAGLISALTAADRGRQVLIITKLPTLLSGNSPWAQGGIVFMGKEDSPEKLKQDIFEAGHWHSWPPAVEILVQLGPRLVRELLIEKYGVPFDRTSEGDLHLTAEGAHSVKRIVHSKDKTGESIHSKLIEAVVKHPNIKYLVDHTAVDLLTLSHHSTHSLDIYEKPTCFGAFVLNNKTGKVFPIFAYKTILATGGLGQIYLHTTNPPEATGDGIAMAYRAGVRMLNLQFIQFHPTAFYNERDRFLISEAVRGEGGRLIDKNGKEFMKEYHELGSLAPRDIVARAIHQTMLKTGHPCVYLDISHKDSNWIKSRFPTIYEHLLEAGIDMTREPIPVVPAAHYSCGGIGVSIRGRTSMARLYAVGEVSCTGVHGANRLASTSLLEAVVWGYNAGVDASEIHKADEYIPPIFPWEEENEEIDPALISQDWLTIKNTMWNYVGLVRTRQRLNRATTILRHLQSEIEQFYQKARMNKEILQLRNGIITAIAVTNATIEDRVSRGAHYIEN
ncbi:L-aspartate oxidase [Bacteroidetes/Chlorobi group bacterium MS-B_bin-24]|jgi:L-aspartate oxidase|nr:MAG: L-aspartate oxidase [Bacteroidetes/Chlorobi group bacterium MS-B_bin-24]